MSDWIQPTTLLYASSLSPWRGNIAGLWVLCVIFIHPRLSSPFYLKQLRLSPHQSVTQHLLINTLFCLFAAQHSFTFLPALISCVYENWHVRRPKMYSLPKKRVLSSTLCWTDANKFLLIQDANQWWNFLLNISMGNNNNKYIIYKKPCDAKLKASI